MSSAVVAAGEVGVSPTGAIATAYFHALVDGGCVQNAAHLYDR